VLEASTGAQVEETKCEPFNLQSDGPGSPGSPCRKSVQAVREETKCGPLDRRSDGGVEVINGLRGKAAAVEVFG
jgi:hypothetical protein